MAKNTRNQPSRNRKNQSEPEAPEDTAPAGYSEQGTSDLAGFWDGKTPIHVIPRGFTLSDSSIEPQKSSVLFICELVDATTCVTRDDRGQASEVAVDAGEMVGLWGKPGLKALLDQGGEPTFVKVTGEKPIKGRPKPMTTFAVLSKRKGTRLSMLDDFRKESIGSTNFALPKTRAGSTSTAQARDWDGNPV